MTNESRPHLKIPEVREPEDRTFYGGGGGTYNRESYRRHGEQIFSEAQSLIQRFESNLDKTVTNKRYFRVELPDDKNVWQSDGKKIAENLHGTLIGSPKKNVGHFSTLAQSFTSLTSEIEQYKNSERGKTKFSEIESINSIPLEEKITESLKYIFESNQYKGEAILSMFPDLNRPEILALKQAISDYLDDNDGAIIAEERMGDSSTFRVKAEKETLENLANYFLAIQTVDPVEEVVVESAIAGPRIEEDVLVEPNRSNAKACIFDSGVVENSRFLDSSIISREEPIGPAYNTAHGTFVASRIIYGNDLRGGISTRQLRPDVKVLSVCMISHDEIGNPLPANGDNFIRIIRDTVERWHDQIRVYNLSMNMVFQGTESASIVTDDHVSPVAAEIDKLSKEYGVLFVLSSGNIPITSLSPTPSEPYPEYFLNETSRICRPSESMLALTCGSFSDRANAGSLAQQSHPSPFTRRGPGFNGYRKPDLVCPGGNYASGWSHFDDIAVAGIGADGNRLDYGNGTSFSAPLITRLAAQLFEMMPNSGPELVRALLVHFSELPTNENSEIYKDIFGNGTPAISSLFSSDKWNQTYIYEGTASYRKIHKVPFYIPRSLISRSGNHKVKVSFTVASSPETNRTLKSGYCKSHLRTKLVKLNSSNETKEVGHSAGSDSLSDRYSTLFRFEKTFSREVGAGDWELIVEQQSKWDTEDTEVPFAVVITVSDPRRDSSVDIYNSIQSETQNRYTEEVQGTIRVR